MGPSIARVHSADFSYRRLRRAGFGASGLGVLPFAELFDDYPSVLIVSVFTCHAMMADFNLDNLGARLRNSLRARF